MPGWSSINGWWLGFAPQSVTPGMAVPGVAALTITPYTPAVSTTAQQTVIPGVASLMITSYTPTADVATPGLTTPALILGPAQTNHVLMGPSSESLIVSR